MKIKNQLTLQRLIGKIDNDFNISESDWIPRVAAWTIDALSQMKVLPMEKKRRVIEVSERIAQLPCKINGTELKVFDDCGREIPELNNSKQCSCSELSNNANSEIAIFEDDGKSAATSMVIKSLGFNSNRNFVLVDNSIELNFDAKHITIESYEVATYYDDYYDCECPYIYNNGLLLEALAWYCMFKYLSRGSSHPVYSLKSNSPVTNPYLQWIELKSKAAAAVKIEINTNGGNGWNNFFYNSTFRPRD